MTDKELIQALRYCADGDCSDCRWWDSKECFREVTYRNCADRLESLLDENESQWVSVSERLPEPGERVLATDGGFVGEFYISNQGQWKRYNVNHHELLMALDILWWMPFPEPPSTEGVE